MNPLDAKGEDERKDWADTSCCWPNVARLFCFKFVEGVSGMHC